MGSDALALADDRSNIAALEEIEQQSSLRVNERTARRRGRDWGLSPSIERASRVSHKRSQLPALKAAPVDDVVQAVAIAPAPVKLRGHVLAEFSDYDGLQRAMRARLDELEMTRAELDARSGLPDRYCSKIFGPSQVRKLGKLSLGCTVGALGCYLALIEKTKAEKLLSSGPPLPRTTTTPRHGAGLGNIGETLGALGCTMVLIEDPVATAKIKATAIKRKLPILRVKLLPPPRPPAIATDQ